MWRGMWPYAFVVLPQHSMHHKTPLSGVQHHHDSHHVRAAGVHTGTCPIVDKKRESGVDGDIDTVAAGNSDICTP